MIIIRESLHSVDDGILISDYVGNIVDLLDNKPKPYRILYDAQADLWIISDDVVNKMHFDLLQQAWKHGWYNDQIDFLMWLTGGEKDSDYSRMYFRRGISFTKYPVGDDKNLLSDKVIHDDSWITPWLYCFVFIPYDNQYYHGDDYGDGYDAKVYTNTGVLYMREFDIDDVPELSRRLEWSNTRMKNEVSTYGL